MTDGIDTAPRATARSPPCTLPGARAPGDGPELRPSPARASTREHPRSTQQLPDLLDDLRRPGADDVPPRYQDRLPPLVHTRGERLPRFPQKSSSPVAGHSPADLPPRDPGRPGGAGSSREEDYHPPRARCRSGPQDALDFACGTELTRRVWRGPSPVVWQGSSDPPGSASSDGIRGSASFFVCSVERFVSCPPTALEWSALGIFQII